MNVRLGDGNNISMNDCLNTFVHIDYDMNDHE